MEKEEKMPSLEELIKEKADSEAKVKSNKAKINQDIEDKILGMEKGRNQVKELEVIYNQAKTNLEYYESLEKAGQLPEDELENYEKAKELVLNIQKNMSDFNEASEKIMTVKGVEGKVMEQAEPTQEYRLREEREKRAEEEAKTEIKEWLKQVPDILVEAEELYKKQEELSDNIDKVKNEVMNDFKGIAGHDVGLKDIVDSFNRHNDISYLKNILENHIDRISAIHFLKKSSLRNFLNGQKLKEYEEARDKYEEFYKETGPHWGNGVVSYFGNAMERKGLLEKIKEIVNASYPKGERDRSIWIPTRGILTEELKEMGDKKLGSDIERVLKYHNIL